MAGCYLVSNILTCALRPLFLSSQVSTRKVAVSIFIQSQSSKVYFNEVQPLAASLQVGFAITGKDL